MIVQFYSFMPLFGAGLEIITIDDSRTTCWVFNGQLMRTFVTLCFCLVSATLSAQENAKKFDEAGKLFQQGNLAEAAKLLVEIDSDEQVDSELRKDVQWSLASCYSVLAKNAIRQEDWKNARQYSELCEEVIENAIEFKSDEQWLAKKYWCYKNLIVAFHGLEDYEQAKANREKLYQEFRNGSLPDGMDKHFNFEFFKHDGKNVWGYEYFKELDDVEAGESFSKIVYFVYSTKEDGSDKDQLFRLHVLKFHKIDASDPNDYVLTKRVRQGDDTGSRTLYNYTYSDPVDVKKLRSDIRDFLDAESKDESDD